MKIDIESNLGRLTYARKNYVEGSECKLLDKDGNTSIFVSEIKGELSMDNIGIYTSWVYVYHNESKQWADIIKEEFDLTTTDGRLDYAKKHYPIGTKYIPVCHSKNICTSTSEPKVWNVTSIECGDGFIYHYGKWADIIKEEEFDMNTDEGRLAYSRKNYPIGTKVISLFHKGNLELIIESDNFSSARTDGIHVSAKKGDGTPTSLFAVIYENGKWAEIIKEEVDMKTQELTRKGLKEIHEVACQAWKDTLKKWGKRNPLENYIELTQEEVNSMFQASDEEQKSILLKYLKQDSIKDLISNIDADELSIITNKLIKVRIGGEYEKLGFTLNDSYGWSIKEDKFGFTCLIPTKKK